MGSAVDGTVGAGGSQRVSCAWPHREAAAKEPLLQAGDSGKGWKPAACTLW